MNASFDLAIPVVLAHEGSSFTNNPADPGGATKFGVTLYALKAAGYDTDGTLFGDVNHDGRIDIEDIKYLSEDQAKHYYKVKWWDHYGFDRLYQEIATKVFDTAVNMGGIPAIKILQRAINDTSIAKVVVDGDLNPCTLSAVDSCNPTSILSRYRLFQAEYYLNLIAHNPKLATFRRGWLRRAAE